MFFMALRSVLARRRLCTQGQKVTATVEGTVRSRDGGGSTGGAGGAGGSGSTGGTGGATGGTTGGEAAQ